MSRKLTEEEFWGRFAPDSSGCWLWTKSKDGSGYGLIRWRQQLWRTHRLAYTLAKGNIPAGLVVRHRCDVAACGNPEHLEVGTHEDNQHDMVQRGRHGQQKKTHCKRGHEFDARYREKRICTTCKNSWRSRSQ